MGRKKISKLLRKIFFNKNKEGRLSYLVSTFLLFLIYFATARFGLTFNPISGFATLVWPPTGIALAAFLIYGYKLWPGIIVGAFLVNYLTGAKVPVALGISIGNTLEALIGAYLLNHFGFRSSLERVKDVWALIVFAAISTFVSALVGPMTLLLGGVIEVGAYIKTSSVWWVGDMLGALIVAPLILVWLTRSTSRLKFINNIELLILYGLLLLTGLISFRGLFGIDTKSLPVLYIVFPPLILFSLRFRQRESVTAIFILSVIAIWGTVEGYGTFAGAGLNEGLLLLQGFMATIAATFMFLTASIRERKLFVSTKDEIISVASHEFKTPIATLKGYSQLLAEYLKNKKDKKLLIYSKNIQQQVNRLNILVEDLLSVARLSLGQLNFEYETFGIDSLVDEVIQGLQNIYPTHKIIFEKRDKAKVYADRNYLSLVLANLVNNAIKFSPNANKVIVRIKKTKVWVIVSIRDFGVGISANEGRQIFEKYYQVENSPDQNFHGFGLGLHISYEIIRGLKGKIWVKSKEGRGSTFYFRIPIKA